MAFSTLHLWRKELTLDDWVPQYLDLPKFQIVSNALNFDTADSHIEGSCDVYITKPTPSDKRLYKVIEGSLEDQRASDLAFSASLSPPKAEEFAESLKLSRHSPFGDLDETSSRRIYAYLVATLNASHTDYNFSHVGGPEDFKPHGLREVVNEIDTTMNNLRPRTTSSLYSAPRYWSNHPVAIPPAALSSSDVWSARCWTIIDEEMDLKRCQIFSYDSNEDPLDRDDGALWAINYLFYNKNQKRVCYLYLRAKSIIGHDEYTTPVEKAKRRARDSWKEPTSSKRSKYWFGDLVEDEEEDEEGVAEAEAEADHAVTLGDAKRPILVVDGDISRSTSEATAGSLDPDGTGLSRPGPRAAPKKLRNKLRGKRRGKRALKADSVGSRTRSKSAVRGVSEDVVEHMEV